MIASWNDLRSTVCTLRPFLRNSSASSASRFLMSLVAPAAASCITSVKIFFSASVSFDQTCGATCVASASTMWPVRMMFFWTS